MSTAVSLVMALSIALSTSFFAPLSHTAASVAVAGADSDGKTSSPDQEVRVVSIELDAGGEGGTIWTEAGRLSGSDRGFGFGSGACAKHPLGDRVLGALFDAMQAGARIRVRSSTNAGGVHCLVAVRFVAP